MIASLPMYDWPELKQSADRFWSVVAEYLQNSGLEAPTKLTREAGNVAHWLREDLLLSQTCGYPFATSLLGKVQLVGAPHYDVDGCYGATYSSAIIVRKEVEFPDVAVTSGAKLAYNSSDSLSGFRCLGPLVGKPLGWFRDSVVSGGHRNSALMVAKGDADIAAIDAVCWDYFQRFEPQAASKLKILDWGPVYPSLPFITANRFSDSDIAVLRDALSHGAQSMSVGDKKSGMKLVRISHTHKDKYSQLTEL